MLVLAVDPGRAKCGLVVMASSGEVLVQEVVPAEELLDRIRLEVESRPIDVVLLGDGTGAKVFRERLAQAGIDRLVDRVELVDEHRTSELARRKYLEENRRGWRRFWPLSLQYPSEPYDDYVALILAQRYLRSQER
ncbi:MAG: pre-16S rRNA-processing nuclease YqgF [Firmicutes bacterium]|nr:pre-16S rRNA-processing nuclease YqgF [Bacillota bacterium]